MHKKCDRCCSAFHIPSDDLAFYERISPIIAGKKFLISPPNLCVLCRKQRRYSWRNEFNYYKRSCDKCSKDIVSVYNPDNPYKVYCSSCYLHRDWDPLDYGVKFDFSKSFFEQFKELYVAVPHITMVNDHGLGSENCEYTFNFVYGKNCYLVSTSWYAENCMYVSKSGRLLDVIDCDNVSESELLHECVSSNKLYDCHYLEDSQNCRNCYFGRDLRGCSNCLCCAGLVQKQYHIFNKPCSKLEYDRQLAKINFGDPKEISQLRIEFKTFLSKLPRRASSLLNCENSSGDRLANCKNTIGFGIWNGENIKYEDFGDTPKNSQDILVAGLCEWCYESQVPDHSNMACFTNYCWSCSEVFYSDDCRYCKNIFGCIGLRKAEYCILNRQYTKEEYETLLPKIIENMRVLPFSGYLNFSSGDFGEFFPSMISPFGYNETIAQDYLPLTADQAISSGFKWKVDSPQTSRKSDSGLAPDKTIQEFCSKDILHPFSCCECGKAYKVQQDELALRQKLKSPFPKNCPKCRRIERTKFMNPTKLSISACDNCGKAGLSRPGEDCSAVLCQECFLQQEI